LRSPERLAARVPGPLTWGVAGWWGWGVGGSAVFVGRDRELSRLRTVVGGGEARLLLVTGDAGVGKTGFVSEAMGRVAGDGGVVVWGGCLPMRESLPLLPVVDALGELSRIDRGALLDEALARTPGYVQVEVVRLLPQRGGEAAESSGVIDAGQRDRLFAAIAELLGAVARRRRIVLVVEDVHWADSATLDCLTFLTRARRDQGPTVVTTCRSDEAPLASHVVEWLAHVRGLAGTAEVRLDPLTRAETAQQVAALVGTPAPAPVVDKLYARTEGNPFFIEQLVAAAWPAGGLGSAAGLPVRLAELLVARAGRCVGAARTVLSALAVAGRPLTEGMLAVVGELEVEDVRRGLRELAAARLLADPGAGGEQRPRHALLAEAVAADLLPGERVAFHERMAAALQAAGDNVLIAEAAGTGPPPSGSLRNFQPGCAPARPPRACSATPRPRGTGGEPSNSAGSYRTRNNRPPSTCPGCISGASTRSMQLARRNAAASSLRRPTAASPTIPTRPSPHR
jgi:predicted ATPase